MKLRRTYKLLLALCLLFLQVVIIIANPIDTTQYYNALVEDLINQNKLGYKANCINDCSNASSVQGSLVITRRNLDISILGRGFLCFICKGDLYYTRYGRLHVGNDRHLLNEECDALQAPIMIPNDILIEDILIDNDGEVKIASKNTATRVVGRIIVYRNKEASLIESKDGINFRFKDEDKVERRDCQILNECLELSTVSVVDTLLKCKEELIIMLEQSIAKEKKVKELLETIKTMMNKLYRKETVRIEEYSKLKLNLAGES